MIQENANDNLLNLMNILRKITVTDELIKRNQSSMVGLRNEIIRF